MITAVPADTPVTIPVPEPTVATMILPLVQVPPPTSDNAVVAPIQTPKTPVMGGGPEDTVITVVVAQPMADV